MAVDFHLNWVVVATPVAAGVDIVEDFEVLVVVVVVVVDRMNSFVDSSLMKVVFQIVSLSFTFIIALLRTVLLSSAVSCCFFLLRKILNTKTRKTLQTVIRIRIKLNIG